LPALYGRPQAPENFRRIIARHLELRRRGSRRCGAAKSAKGRRPRPDDNGRFQRNRLPGVKGCEGGRIARASFAARQCVKSRCRIGRNISSAVDGCRSKSREDEIDSPACECFMTVLGDADRRRWTSANARSVEGRGGHVVWPAVSAWPPKSCSHRRATRKRCSRGAGRFVRRSPDSRPRSGRASRSHCHCARVDTRRRRATKTRRAPIPRASTISTKLTTRLDAQPAAPSLARQVCRSSMSFEGPVIQADSSLEFRSGGHRSHKACGCGGAVESGFLALKQNI